MDHDRDRPVDFFISHASEDKSSFVRDLVDQLLRIGASVFYDEYSIEYGQSLTASINSGMSRAKNVVVVLSPAFFEKSWTNSELQAAFNLHVGHAAHLVPVFHQVTPEAVRKRYPFIADIKGVSSSLGCERVASELIRTAGIQPVVAYLRIPCNPDWSDAAEEAGWSIFCGRLSFPYRDSSSWPRMVVEYGLAGDLTGRLRIVLLWNSHICFEVVDLDHRMVRVAGDISSWQPREDHYVVASLSRQPCVLTLALDGNVADHLRCEGLRLPAALCGRTGGVIGGSVDLHSFCSFALGSFAYYTGALSIEDARAIQEAEQLHVGGISDRVPPPASA